MHDRSVGSIGLAVVWAVVVGARRSVVVPQYVQIGQLKHQPGLLRGPSSVQPSSRVVRTARSASIEARPTAGKTDKPKGIGKI